MTFLFSAIYDLQYTFTPLRDLTSNKEKKEIHIWWRGEGKPVVECRGATATKSDWRGRWRNILILNILILQTKTMDQYCYSDSPAAVLVCVLWTILPSPPCCSGSFRRTNGAWIPVSLVQLLAQFFILNCRHNFAGCLFSQIIKIKHRDFTPALNKLRHATAIILLKFARGLASKYL